ncbi:MAG: M20/M25/M40 family metallo-hydrolase, partial [Spirochaetota bacterium]
MNASLIAELAAEYSAQTAENLSRMVQVPSLSGEEKEVIALIEGMANEAGFDEVRVDPLGNLVARIGDGPRALAIDAHVDTVDTGDRSQWNHDPFSGLIADGYVHGRGSVDQEGGAASMITAGRILRELGYGGGWTIYFTFTVMEEDCDGLCWNYLIEQEGIRPELAVITEPTNLGVYRGHRGR